MRNNRVRYYTSKTYVDIDTGEIIRNKLAELMIKDKQYTVINHTKYINYDKSTIQFRTIEHETRIRRNQLNIW